MIEDEQVRDAVHALRGFAADLIPVFERHGLITLMVVRSNAEAAEILDDENCRAIEQDGPVVLIGEFEPVKGGADV